MSLTSCGESRKTNVRVADAISYRFRARMLGWILEIRSSLSTVSTDQLQVLRLFHLPPIKHVISVRSYLVNPEGELISRSASHLDAFSGYPERTVATERCPWQDNSYTIGPLTPVLSYWGQLLSTHLRAHWIETDFLLQGQLISCFRWHPTSPQGSDHIFPLYPSESGVWPVRIPIT